MGNRVCKIEKPYNLTSTGWKYTFYVRDASGNIMTTYTKTGSEIENNVLKLDEVMLYGSSRIGTREVNMLLSGLTVPTTTFSRALGLKRYEIGNHLGNVLATFTDRKKQVQSGSSVTGYETYIASAQDYYPFGMIMNERKWNTSGYRFGFNGMEKDDEIYGDGNATTALFWEYDPRIGRRWNMDPVIKTWESSYSTFLNCPILLNDANGDKVDPSGLYEKNKDGTYKDPKAILAFELFASTKAKKKWILERAEKGFQLQGVFVKTLNIIAKKSGKLDEKGIDYSFSIGGIQSSFNASGETQDKVGANGRLNINIALEQTSSAQAFDVLEEVETICHEVLYHGKIDEKQYLKYKSGNLALLKPDGSLVMEDNISKRLGVTGNDNSNHYVRAWSTQYGKHGVNVLQTSYTILSSIYESFQYNQNITRLVPFSYQLDYIKYLERSISYLKTPRSKDYFLNMMKSSNIRSAFY